MVDPQALPEIHIDHQVAYRLVNTKLPPIHLFDDVANADEFAALYEVQAITNPRLLNEAGDLNLLPNEEIPFGIPGCSAAVAPFTHVSPDGSRFSNGDFGVLYLARTEQGAIEEVSFHQQRYLSQVEGLSFDRLVFRCYVAHFGGCDLVDLTGLTLDHPVYDPEDYSASQALGVPLRQRGVSGVQYHSVRRPGDCCWGLFTPGYVQAMNQGPNYELIWNGSEISFRGKIESSG